MSATIVYVPQFKDLLLEKMPVTRDQALTAQQIQNQLFPDHISSDIRIALKVLRKWRAVDRYYAKRDNVVAAHWWRVA